MLMSSCSGEMDRPQPMRQGRRVGVGYVVSLAMEYGLMSAHPDSLRRFLSLTRSHSSVSA